MGLIRLSGTPAITAIHYYYYYYPTPSYPSLAPLSAGLGPIGLSARIRPGVVLKKSARIGMGLGRIRQA
jgi:hypothetical protein